MKLEPIVIAVLLASTGCAARSITTAQSTTAQSIVVPSRAANVLALVQEPAQVDEPAPAVENDVDLADLDLQIPQTSHDFALREHTSNLTQRAADTAKPKAMVPDTFSFPGPDHEAQTSK